MNGDSLCARPTIGQSRLYGVASDGLELCTSGMMRPTQEEEGGRLTKKKKKLPVHQNFNPEWDSVAWPIAGDGTQHGKTWPILSQVTAHTS